MENKNEKQTENGILAALSPARVFYYFEKICGIPHGSGNVAMISDYLVDFAKVHGLKVYQDALYNVIIIKEATPGLEDAPALMLQGHMDMVAVKDAEVKKDLATEGLDLAIDGDFVYAKGTSLGGDDGIAIAYGLALLEMEDLVHPRLELVVTTEEEVGMEGATGIDLSPCQAKMMLNIDSEEEGEFVVSCAGGVRVNGSLPIAWEEIALACDQPQKGADVLQDQNEAAFSLHKITISGLTGGHSGTEIHKNSANANILMGRILDALSKEVDIRLISLQGGEKDNAIPIEAEAVVAVAPIQAPCLIETSEKTTKAVESGDKDGSVADPQEVMKQQIALLQKSLGTKYATTDPRLTITCEPCQGADIQPSVNTVTTHVAAVTGITQGTTTGFTLDSTYAMTAPTTRHIIDFLLSAPNGVQAMCQDMPELVETSLNLGIIRMRRKADAAAADTTHAATTTTPPATPADAADIDVTTTTLPATPAGDTITFTFALRSSVTAQKCALRDRVCDLIKAHGGTYTLTGDYPAWEYAKDSSLRPMVAEAYRQQYGKEPKFLSIHAGLECGIFASKIPGLDCVSLGPDLFDIHTTRERMSISSVARTWELLLSIIDRCSKQR